MAEKVSQGQADKAAAEARTAQVGAENKQDAQARQREAAAAEKRQGSASAEGGQDDRNAVREELAKADSAADKFQQAQDAGQEHADEVALNPYPAYEDREVSELKSAAEGRDVEINRDVEKAELVRLLRENDPRNAAGLDFMTLEQLRSLAGEKDVELGEEFLRAHLVTELRAADTGVNNPGDHVL